MTNEELRRIALNQIHNLLVSGDPEEGERESVNFFESHCKRAAEWAMIAEALRPDVDQYPNIGGGAG